MIYSSDYSSVLKFTIDGRPTMEDIHYLFSLLVSQVPVSTHKHMFRSYENTFITEDALNVLVSPFYSKSYESSGVHLSSAGSFRTLKLNRDMAKALLQQFLWSRLIENACESYNKTYKDKGIWRVTSKGLCVAQEFCTGTNTSVSKLSHLVDVSSRLMYLYQIERMQDTDRVDCSKRYISSLFAIMIASLPLRHNINNDVKMAHPARYLDEDAYSISSADSNSTLSSSSILRGLSFADYFPFINILPNDLLIHANPKNAQQFNHKTCFLQQKILLQNLSPSSNKFKMRAVFSSLLCCNWLLEFCTVASTDEAESIMNAFLDLGWITFFQEKYKHCTSIDSSKSSSLNLTRAGMQVVIDVSLEKYNNVHNQPCGEIGIERMISNSKRCSATSSATSVNKSDILMPTSMTFEEKETLRRAGYSSKLPTLPLLQTTSMRTNSTSNSSSTVTTPVLEKQSFGHNYFDVAPIIQMSPCSDTKAWDVHPSLPSTPTGDTKESNSSKLKTILKDKRLQLLFRDFLGANFCVENFDFWKDHDKFLKNFRRQKSNGTVNHRQLLEDAYILWDIYLKPGALRELNIDHTLRQDMAEDISKMLTLVHTYTSGQTKPVLMVSTQSPAQSLTIAVNWLDKVNHQICKLMATDSIPKFIRMPEYKEMIQEEAYDNKSKTTIFTNDLKDFPSPPQRKLKETIYL